MALVTDDLLDALRACFAPSDPWLEYGVVEQRLRDRAPDVFAKHVLRSGHRMFGPSTSSASVRIAQALGRLRAAGELHTFPGRSTGAAWSATIGYWGTDPARPHDEVLSWVELRRATGRPADQWCDDDRAGLHPPASVPGQPPTSVETRVSAVAEQAPVGEVDHPLHPVYLPYTADQLLEHFLPATGQALPNPENLTYYGKSLGYAANGSRTAVLTAGEQKLAHQIEKDERFWVIGALMPVARSADPVAAWTSLLTRCLGAVPPVTRFTTWGEALGPAPKLYFEARLPSPPSYRAALLARLGDAVLTPTRRAAAHRPGVLLEGPTHVDALLVGADGFTVAFEAKVESDASTKIEYDVTRNQIARNVDVLLERSPDAGCLVLLTPEVFRRQPTTRLYGWLMTGYRADPLLLARHLPHRTSMDFVAVSRRLGWLTYEDVREVFPDTCAWLDTSPSHG